MYLYSELKHITRNCTVWHLRSHGKCFWHLLNRNSITFRRLAHKTSLFDKLCLPVSVCSGSSTKLQLRRQGLKDSEASFQLFVSKDLKQEQSPCSLSLCLFPHRLCLRHAGLGTVGTTGGDVQPLSGLGAPAVPCRSRGGSGSPVLSPTHSP